LNTDRSKVSACTYYMKINNNLQTINSISNNTRICKTVLKKYISRPSIKYVQLHSEYKLSDVYDSDKRPINV